jgi:hypothetical protein
VVAGENFFQFGDWNASGLLGYATNKLLVV